MSKTTKTNPSHASLHGSLQYPRTNRRKMNEHPPQIHTDPQRGGGKKKKKGSANIKPVGIVEFKGQQWTGVVVQFGIQALIHNMFDCYSWKAAPVP